MLRRSSRSMQSAQASQTTGLRPHHERYQPKPTRGYGLARWVAGTLASLQYRVEVRGALPNRPATLLKDPAILAMTHHNGLVDVMVAARVADRPVRVFAKASLFDIPVAGRIFRAAGALPVFR